MPNDGFGHLDPHATLKRLQLECKAGCEFVDVMKGGEVETYVVPMSLSFASMDETAFRQVFAALCDHVAATYWHDLDANEIEAMTGVMVEP